MSADQLNNALLSFRTARLTHFMNRRTFLIVLSFFLNFVLFGINVAAQQVGRIPRDEDEKKALIRAIPGEIPPTPETLYTATEQANQTANFYDDQTTEIPKRIQALNADEKKRAFRTKADDLQKAISTCGPSSGHELQSKYSVLQASNDSLVFQYSQLDSGNVGDKRFDLSMLSIPPAQLCHTMRQDKDLVARLVKRYEDNLNAVSSVLNLQIGYSKDLADAWKQRANKLAAAKQDIVAKLEKQQAFDILRALPWMVGILCLFSCVVMYGVKFFNESVQFELVSSGQLIQFPTVMVLLVVIISLGLAHVLTENTLAALLGGLAGYVLSQGVGQAAARRVSAITSARSANAPVAAPGLIQTSPPQVVSAVSPTPAAPAAPTS